MTDLMIRVLRWCGVDRAIGYGVLTRGWSLLAGPVTILVIATRMTVEQQGFYYTFSSLLALQVFFELGLMSVIAQFASHEFAHLEWGGRGEIHGDDLCLSRLIELLRKALKWFGVVSLLMIAILIPLGLAFLSHEQSHAVDFAWRLPWIVAVIGVAANLLAIPFMSVVMGSGDVATVNHRELIGAIAGSLASCLVIFMNGGLFAVSAVNVGNAVITWGYLLRRKPELLKLARRSHHRQPAPAGIGWWREVWPMQWKIGVSWASGYFIYQLFNPVLFHYHGAVAAGRMGITLSASNALLGAAIAWLNTKSPEFGKLIAVRNWQALDAAFRKVYWQAVGFSACGGIAGWGAIALLQAYHPLGQRFIPAGEAAILLMTVSVQTSIIGLAMYLRAHKKEPFFAVSVVGALLQGLTTWYMGMHFSTLGITSGFLGVSLLFGLPSAWVIWKRCRAEWHSGFPAA